MMRGVALSAAFRVASESLNLGEWAVSDDLEGVLICRGLGSCVALCLHDPVARIGAMAHMVLPDSSATRASTAGAKFVDLAVPLLLEEMTQRGVVLRRLYCYLAGGAQLISQSTTPLGRIGERNAEAARVELRSRSVRVHAEDIGGQHGRTVEMRIGTGEVIVTQVGSPPRTLSGRAPSFE